MILEQLGISEEEFDEYLDLFIDETSVEEVFRMAGLLPSFTSSIQVEPKLVKSDKNKLKTSNFENNIELKINETNIMRNHNLNSYITEENETINIENRPSEEKNKILGSAA